MRSKMKGDRVRTGKLLEKLKPIFRIEDSDDSIDAWHIVIRYLTDDSFHIAKTRLINEKESSGGYKPSITPADLKKYAEAGAERTGWLDPKKYVWGKDEKDREICGHPDNPGSMPTPVEIARATGTPPLSEEKQLAREIVNSWRKRHGSRTQ